MLLPLNLILKIAVVGKLAGVVKHCAAFRALIKLSAIGWFTLSPSDRHFRERAAAADWAAEA